MKRFWPLTALVTLLALAGCGGGQPSGEKPFSYSLDPSLTPTPQERGGKTLAAARSEDGLVHLFIANEVLIAPKDRAELEGFLARTGGTVIDDDAVPDPPPGSNIQVDPAFKTPTQYIVRVDPSRFSLESFNADAQRAGLRGATVFSSEAAARLLAGIVKEKVAGLRVSPNFVFEPAGVLFRTEEAPLPGGGYEDALQYERFACESRSKSCVNRMLQLVAASPPPRRTKVAIIDGGFWLDREGRSRSPDLPADPLLQYDFVAEDYTADGPNPANCSGGGSCPWHGTGAAHVAVAQLNNRFGAAGTGGQVADPMLFKTNLDWGQVASAIRTAVAWGADVISMSFAGNCDNLFCDLWFEFNLYPALRNARDSGVVLVAAAGNENQSANGKVPCKAAEDVICVGALEDNTNRRIGYSNYGTSVAIWAPTNLKAIYGGDPAGGLGLDTFAGTSASTPFIAGIAAVLRAYNPSLTSAQVRDILRRTAWTDSPDPNVTHYVNAYRALREVHRFNPDALEPNNNDFSATNLGTPGSPTRRVDLNLHDPSDRDHFRFTLSEYARLEINVEFVPALGDLNLALVKLGGALGAPEGLVNELRPDGQGRTYRARLAPPGDYRLVVAPGSGSTLNAYNLSVAKVDTPMAPDGYEPNDTWDGATSLPVGSYWANLHSLSDVDFYRFTDTLSGFLGDFVFAVTNRDMPLTLRLFNGSGAEIRSVACPSSSSSCTLTLPDDSYRVKVETPSTGGSRGRYLFRAAFHLDRSFLDAFTLYPDLPILVLDPSDPAPGFPGYLTGLRDLYVFRHFGDKASRARLVGEGLKFSLFSRTGQLIREGLPSNDPQLPGAEISLAGLQDNELYVLMVERRDGPTVIDGEEAILGILPYSLDLD